MLAKDVARTVAFYRDVLGFEVPMRAPAAAAPAWALVTHGEAELFFHEPADALETEALRRLHAGVRPPVLRVASDDLARRYERAAAAGVPVQAHHDAEAGTHAVAVRDPDGYLVVLVAAAPTMRRAA